MAKIFLLGVDGSECGERALEVAADHVRASSGKLVLCYVIPWSPFTFSTAEENAERHRRREEELSIAMTKFLQPRAKALGAEGLDVEVVARHGHPAKTLAALAREYDADTIVIGNRGDTPLKTRILGGTATALIQISHCPVLVVP